MKEGSYKNLQQWYTHSSLMYITGYRIKDIQFRPRNNNNMTRNKKSGNKQKRIFSNFGCPMKI